MGFQPLVYGNVKGFLNLEPSREDMDYWAARQGISLDKCISFTDGTKVQFEQALVANGLAAGIASDGLLGVREDDLKRGALKLADVATQRGHAISDFVVCPTGPPGVFVVGTHQSEQQSYLRNFKLGEGPYYLLLRNYHLCHLEIGKTIRRVVAGGPPLLDNSCNPTVGVAAVTKHAIPRGYVFGRNIGSFDTRGIAVRITENPRHVPIGLLAGAVSTRPLEHGRMLTCDDVDIPDSLAYRAWRSIAARERPERGD
jgi:predicted homoserine dehydrogenase-like protein